MQVFIRNAQILKCIRDAQGVIAQRHSMKTMSTAATPHEHKYIKIVGKYTNRNLEHLSTTFSLYIL